MKSFKTARTPLPHSAAGLLVCFLIAVHDALRQAQINIPFPQREVHVTAPDHAPPRS